MLDNINNLLIQAKIDIKKSKNVHTLESIRIKYLGKRGYCAKYINIMHDLDVNDKPKAGAIINHIKQEINTLLNIHKNRLETAILKTSLKKEYIDVSLPGRHIENGGLHPITYIIQCIENLFSKLGFSIITSPEIEDYYHNFHALNIPDFHSSLNHSDTFWINNNYLLRTHTSGAQIRIMKTHPLPIRMISSGRVYRKDHDRTHTPMFHQIEGLMIDKDIHFTSLKGLLHDFLLNFFEEKIEIRFRPSYFPFTEPSAEIDIKIKNSHWLEVLGCGMVHPNVLNNVKINQEEYSGFAFGMGVERLAMLRYGVDDVRKFFRNDLRFLKQFHL